MAVDATDRRGFLVQAALGVAACACGTAFAGCAFVNLDARPVSAAAGPDGRVPLGPLAELPVGGQLKVTIDGTEGAILVVRISDAEVRAVAITCTHRQSEVGLVADRSKFRCPAHKSEFWLDGAVLRGPAAKPLRAHKVTIDDGALYLEVSRA